VSGDTLKTVEFKGDPVQLCAAVCKDERPGSAKGKVRLYPQVAPLSTKQPRAHWRQRCSSPSRLGVTRHASWELAVLLLGV
jgi:hypothetical protein